MAIMSIRNKNLASLMAQENLNVVFDTSVKTAYFEPSTRKLILPVWNIDNQSVIDFLITHEVGHALHSDGLLELMEEIPTEVHAYIRILEDCRVDRLQRERFPGTKKDYFLGTKEVLDMDVFNLNDTPVETMILIDRINMKSKFGLHRSVPFNNDIERSFAARALSLETMDEVIELAHEIYEYEKEKAQEEQQEQQEQQDNGGISKERTKVDTDEMQDSVGDVPQAKGDESLEQEGPAGDEDGFEDKGSDEQKFSDDSSEDDADEGTDSSDTTNSNPIPPPTPCTDLIMDEWSKKNTEERSYYARGRSQHYVEIGSLEPDKVLFNRKIFMGFLKEKYKGRGEVLANLRKVEKDMSGYVSALSKEFSVFKQARTSSLLKTNKGCIDVNRLHLHQINENIFTSSIVTQNRDENHRLVFVLDVSSSMFTGKSICTVMNQLLIFRRFCKNEGISFNVITFTSFHPTWIADLHKKGELDNVALYDYAMKCGYLQDEGYGGYGVNMYDRPFMVEVLNDTDNDEWFAMLYDYLSTYWISHTNYFPIGQTPLNESMSNLYGWLVALRRNMREDRLSLMVLTDGESTDYLSGNTIVRDHFTKQEYTSMDNVDIGMTRTRNCENYYNVYTSMIAIKALKENKIIDSCIWYNVVENANMVGNCDVYRLYSKVFTKELIRRGLVQEDMVMYTNLRGVITDALRKNGLFRMDDAIPGIDSFFMYFPPAKWQLVNKKLSKRVTNEVTIAADTFTRGLREKSIIKGLCASVAKRIA